MEDILSAANILTWLVVGRIIGWLAGKIMTHGSVGIQADLIVGTWAGVLGGALLALAGFNLGERGVALLGQIVNSAFGAVIGMFLWRALAPIVMRLGEFLRSPETP
jgi:uncharacterized membrane protein YeaQ/YmgE (transglycosylase-associated protein family)